MARRNPGKHRWEILTLDVWGNARDGYDVNNVFSSGQFIELPADFSDADVLKALKAGGFAKPGIRASSVEIDGDDGFLSVDYMGRPEIQLRRVD